jgi:hypothetical protein
LAWLATSLSCVIITIGHTLIVEHLEKLHDLRAGLAVQRAGRFIGEQDLRIVDDCAGDRHALALAAGKLVRLEIHAVAETYTL